MTVEVGILCVRSIRYVYVCVLCMVVCATAGSVFAAAVWIVRVIEHTEHHIWLVA
jgi:hypothetical protein